MAGHVTHSTLLTHAEDKVNISKAEAAKRRAQVGYLRTRLEVHIAEHPDYDLVKLRASGSTAKHTAIRRRGSDADVAAYVTAASVGGVTADEAGLLQWLLERCIQVYGNSKVADDFKISDHAVGITMHDSGLKIDVAPVLYEGLPDDRGYLVTRQGDRVLTSVTQHIAFINTRKKQAGPGYAGLIRLLKAWIGHSKAQDVTDTLRCKSFIMELIVAHLWRAAWNGEPLRINDYPRAFEQVLAYIARTGLTEPICFDDFYSSNEVPATDDPIQIWDPVNPDNNVARTYTETDRVRLVAHATEALGEVSYAATAQTKAEANDAWRTVFGPTFAGA